MTSFKPPGQCPACGEWVPRGQAACDCCGACDKSGWKSETDVYDGLDLPDDPADFNYDEFLEKEFGKTDGKRSTAKNRELFWRWVGAILLIVMVLGYVVAAFRG
jgi:hypothetical protein